MFFPFPILCTTLAHRAAAPLKQAEDAVLLDTSDLNFEQSLAAMKKIIAEKVN